MVTRTYRELYLKELEALPLEGPVPRGDVEVLWEFETDLVNLLEGAGCVWRGTSFKNQGWSVLLVMKVARGDVPLVAFITDRTTGGCMRSFLRQLKAGDLAWREDKFA